MGSSNFGILDKRPELLGKRAEFAVICFLFCLNRLSSGAPDVLARQSHLVPAANGFVRADGNEPRAVGRISELRNSATMGHVVV